MPVKELAVEVDIELPEVETTEAEPVEDDALQKKCDRLERKQSDIQAAERKVAEAEGDWKGAQQDAKDAKQYFDSAVSNLRAIIRRNADQPELPFADEPQADEAWRAVTLESLGLSGKLVDILVENDLDTMGKLADYTAGEKLLTDLNGVGPAKAEEIEAACQKYWEQNPRECIADETSEVHDTFESNGDGEDD